LEKTHTILSSLPLDVLVMGFTYLMYALALFGFRLFDPVALARLTLMEQLSDGMLVLDPRGRVASLNPAAEKIFGLPARQVKGRPVREVLPAYPDELQPEAGGTEMEFSLSGEEGCRDYRLAISRLTDWHGQEAGRLLLLRDVTEQKCAQAQLLEQQRALSAMKEREQVGRELHDELSQNLAFINVQAQAAGELLSAGDSEQAGAHLRRLAAVAREAHVDVRGQISDLSLNILPEEGFVGALRRFIEKFSSTYSIQAELILPEPEPAISLAPTGEVQVLRIIQEAFTNIGKHACARHARVTLATTAAGFEVIVADDGQGFDPQERSASGKTFGLRIMQERAVEIGGSLQVESQARGGTRVIVRIPR
jgi:PAS domain S-box-containing protein